MPVIDIKPIRTRLDQTDKYIKNEEKTDIELWDYIALGSSYEEALQSVYNYTTKEDKTYDEKQYFISGINCDPKHSVEEFIETQKMFGKWGKGVVAHHGWVSFPSGYVINPEDCHRFTMELLKTKLGDRFQIAVTTHLDRMHLHSHFLINAVSFKDGKKYHGNQETLWELRRASDELCLKYGYPTIDNPRFYGEDRGLYRAELKGEKTWRDLVKKDIDRAISVSKSLDDFYRELQKNGYKLKLDRKYIAVSPPNMTDHSGRRIFIRLRSLKDEDYTLNGIERRILGKGERRDYRYDRTYRKTSVARPKKLPVYVRRYYRFMYSFGLMKKTPRKFSYYKMQEYHKRAERTNALLKYLLQEKFETNADVLVKHSVLTAREIALKKDRNRLYKQTGTEENIEEINSELKKIREEKKIAERILDLFNERAWVIRKDLEENTKETPEEALTFNPEERRK